MSKITIITFKITTEFVSKSKEISPKGKVPKAGKFTDFKIRAFMAFLDTVLLLFDKFKV